MQPGCILSGAICICLKAAGLDMMSPQAALGPQQEAQASQTCLSRIAILHCGVMHLGGPALICQEGVVL